LQDAAGTPNTCPLDFVFIVPLCSKNSTSCRGKGQEKGRREERGMEDPRRQEKRFPRGQRRSVSVTFPCVICVFPYAGGLKHFRCTGGQLLEDKGVKSSMKWEEALKLIQATCHQLRMLTSRIVLISPVQQAAGFGHIIGKAKDDRRFGALTAAGERKQAFAEYITQTKKREKEEEREKRKRAKDDFIEALQTWKDLKLTTRYKDTAEHFYNEEWFKLLEEDERDLELEFNLMD